MSESVATPETPARTAAPRIVYALLAAVAITFTVDSVAFRTDLYRKWIDPESFAGQVDLVIRRCAGAASGKNAVVVGDSRMGEGFSQRVANETTPHLHWFSAAVSGTTPRSWYYLLREIDPNRDRFGVIVIPVDSYDDEDGTDELADRTLDTRILIFCLRLSDLSDYPFTFRGARARFETWRALLFKGFIVRDDIRAFLADPSKRIETARLFAQYGKEWSDNYTGRPTTVSLDEARASALPREYPQTGRYGAYRSYWFRRIIARYRGTPVRIVFARAPAAPIPRPQPPIRFSRVIPTLSSASVTVLDENLFSSLEQPRFFFDTSHLNTAGRERFSAALAQSVSNAL